MGATRGHQSRPGAARAAFQPRRVARARHPGRRPCGRWVRACRRRRPEPPPLTNANGWATRTVLSLDARRQVVSLPAAGSAGCGHNLAVRSGPLVRSAGWWSPPAPMTARGIVFLASGETGMVNVTLWPGAWARLRGVVRRRAALRRACCSARRASFCGARDQIASVAETGGPARPMRAVARLGRQAGWALLDAVGAAAGACGRPGSGTSVCAARPSPRALYHGGRRSWR
jgi:hypothetical protein